MPVGLLRSESVETTTVSRPLKELQPSVLLSFFSPMSVVMMLVVRSTWRMLWHAESAAFAVQQHIQSSSDTRYVPPHSYVGLM
jgi:hypothetical protein